MSLTRTSLLHGAVAGAVGTTALNATTYVDMALRGRPGSTTPEQVVERGAASVGVRVPGDGAARDARTSALGALLGMTAGVATGVALGALRAGAGGRGGTVATAWLLAMVAGNGPMTLLRVTDPRTWTATDWAADVVPHLSYALAAAATLELLEHPARP
jgi:hypothetical protein